MAAEKIIIDFWDVGQGDATVIRLPDDKIILLDVGPKNSPVIDWLADKTPDIHAVTISHNDKDHAGALPSLVKMPTIRIGTIYMLVDRDKKSSIFQNLWEPVKEQADLNRFSVLRLTQDEIIWQNENTCLKVIYPNFIENVAANNPNQTSAVICLFFESEPKIVWAGDAPMQVIANKCQGNTPYLLHGPHHGAPIDKNQGQFKDWVNAFRPDRVFISVGTNNTYSHPSSVYLQSQVKQGCQVSCTQLTSLCDRNHIRNDTAVLQTAGLLGLRSNRSGVPCRGCLRLTMANGVIASDPFDAEHLRRVKMLRRPKCL